MLSKLGVDPIDWREHMVRVLGWAEGAAAVREGRRAETVADSPAELRFAGPVVVDSAASHVVDLAQAEAAANQSRVGLEHVLVALLLEGESVAAGTGHWLGMTVGRVRAAAGLVNERRVGAEGAPPRPTRRGPDVGPVVLCGGSAGPELLAQVASLSRQRTGQRRPRAVLVDLGWRTHKPTPAQRRRRVDHVAEIGDVDVVDSGLTERPDAYSDEACGRLASADLVWLAGGDAAAIYDRLWATPALDAIHLANQSGAVIGGVSAGAVVWGAGTLSDYASLGDAEPFPLFRWLDDLVVFAHYWPTREPALRERLAAFPGCRAVGVAHGGAVVAGPRKNDLRVLRRGKRGTDIVLLAGNEETATPI